MKYIITLYAEINMLYFYLCFIFLHMFGVYIMY